MLNLHALCLSAHEREARRRSQVRLFSFFRSLTDPLLSHTSPTLHPRRVAFTTPRIIPSSRITSSSSCVASPSLHLMSPFPCCVMLSPRLFVTCCVVTSPLRHASPCRIASPLLTLCGRAMRFLGCPVPRPSAQCAGLFSFLFLSFFHSLTPLLSHVPSCLLFHHASTLSCSPSQYVCHAPPPRHVSVTRRHLATRCPSSRVAYCVASTSRYSVRTCGEWRR